MEQNKIRMKIGDNEFEAEGSAEIVQAQLAAFKELISSIPASKAAIGLDQSSEPERQAPSGSLALDKIMKTEGRIVSLTARPSSVEDAVMLLLLGQKTFRNNDGATGSEIIDGLRVSGQSADRIDRVLEKALTREISSSQEHIAESDTE